MASCVKLKIDLRTMSTHSMQNICNTNKLISSLRCYFSQKMVQTYIGCFLKLLLFTDLSDDIDHLLSAF